MGESLPNLKKETLDLTFYAGWPCTTSGLIGLKKHIGTEQKKRTEERK